MNDLSKLSDAELIQLYQKSKSAPAKPDLSKLSDEELIQLARSKGVPTSNSSATRDNVLAATGSIVEGVPIIGGPLREGLNKAGAVKRALLNDTPYGSELALLHAEQERLRQEKPIVTTAGNVAGAVLGTAPAAATTLGAKALGLVGKNLLTRSAASAGSGAAISGVDAATRGQEIVPAMESGALFGAGAPVVGQTVGAVGRTLFGKGRPSSAVVVSDIQAAKRAEYQKLDSLGAAYKPQAMKQLIVDTMKDLRAKNINPERHKVAVSLLKDMAKLTNRPVSVTELDQFRQVIRRDTPAGDEAEQFFADEIIDHIDDFVESASQRQMVSADARQTAETLANARRLNTQFRKAELIELALDKAARQAGKGGSGGNIENAIRQQIDAILNSPKKVRAFTQTEKALMKRIVMGGRGQDLWRTLGKLSPMGQGLMAALGTGGIIPMPAMAGGIASRAVSEGATNRNVQALEQAVHGNFGRPVTGPGAGASATQLAVQQGLIPYQLAFPEDPRLSNFQPR